MNTMLCADATPARAARDRTSVGNTMAAAMPGAIMPALRFAPSLWVVCLLSLLLVVLDTSGCQVKQY